MAEMQDLVDEVSEIDAVSAEIQEQSAASAEPQATPQDDDDLPEKYKGKSKKQLADELEHANKSMGRYSNELGEVRRLADELIRSQLKPQNQEEQPKEVDFFENPQEAIRRAVESNPRVQQAEQYALAAQRQMAQQKLAQLHPDFGQVVQDAEFAKWVGASPVRVKLFKAAESYDVESAHELLSTFKELKAVKQQHSQSQVSDAEKSARTKTMQAAAVDTGGSGESSKKIYRRADLISLKLRDPRKFDAMQDEIDAAYRDGRVK
jgi:hypothetical protein